MLEIPESISQAYQGWNVSVAWNEFPGATTYRLASADASVRFLKLAVSDAAVPLSSEAERMRWLQGRLPVPEVLEFDQDEDVAWLITDALPGLDLTRLPRPGSERAGLSGFALRMFHGARIDDCPYDVQTPTLIALAHARADAGLIDPEAHFHEEFSHLTVADALSKIDNESPDPGGSVLCHGDFSFPNILVDGRAVSGFVDLGEMGVGDPWWDIAIASWSATWNLGPGFELDVMEAYGVEPDWDRIGYFRLLYELVS